MSGQSWARPKSSGGRVFKHPKDTMIRTWHDREGELLAQIVDYATAIVRLHGFRNEAAEDAAQEAAALMLGRTDLLPETLGSLERLGARIAINKAIDANRRERWFNRHLERVVRHDATSDAVDEELGNAIWQHATAKFDKAVDEYRRRHGHLAEPREALEALLLSMYAGMSTREAGKVVWPPPSGANEEVLTRHLNRGVKRITKALERLVECMKSVIENPDNAAGPC